jgi:membrane peptidoglycan carboxypeptidase
MLEAEWQETYEIKEAAKAPSFTIRWPRRCSIIVFISITVAISLIAGAIWEMRTSRIQARVLSGIASKLSFQLESGPSDSIRFPKAGPLDRRLGYANLQDYANRLTENGYSIDAQARFSPQLIRLSDKGIFIPYHEKSQAGLRILDRDDRVLSDTCYPGRVYRDFDEIPDLVVRTLLFIENRELLDTRHPYRNPAVEWDRLAKVSLDMAIHLVKKDHKVPGGSTLATQLQKYKHSPDGRTASPTEKFRQMISAMLKSYMNGEKTIEAQRQIVLEYINSIPLAASPGYGEVHGLGDGLWSWYGADLDFVNHCLSDEDSVKSEERALAYKQVLSLFLAHRLPTHYLVEDQDTLKSWTDRYVAILSKAGVISKQIRDDMLKTQLHLLQRAPAQPSVALYAGQHHP